MSRLKIRNINMLINEDEIEIVKKLLNLANSKFTILTILYRLCKEGRNYFLLSEMIDTFENFELLTRSTVRTVLDQLKDEGYVSRRKTIIELNGKLVTRVVYFINCNKVNEVINFLKKLLRES